MDAEHDYQELPDGSRLAYIDRGQGDPLLVIHGFTGTAIGHLGIIIDALSADYRVIAPDLRGYGASSPPPRDFPPGFYQRDAADMAALLDALQPGRVVVLGFSDGAETAILLAASRPDLVRGVVGWGISGVISPEMLASVQSWLPVSAWGPERDSWKQEIIGRHGADQLESMVSGWVSAARAIVAQGGNICLAQAAGVASPVLLLNGSGEVGNTPRDVLALASEIRDCRLVFVPDSKHAIQDDQPVILLDEIRAFLDSLPE